MKSQIGVSVDLHIKVLKVMKKQYSIGEAHLLIYHLAFIMTSTCNSLSGNTGSRVFFSKCKFQLRRTQPAVLRHSAMNEEQLLLHFLSQNGVELTCQRISQLKSYKSVPPFPSKISTVLKHKWHEGVFKSGKVTTEV